MTIYYRKNLAELPCNVGIDQEDGSRSSDGNGGYLSFGPNITVGAGLYFGGFHVRAMAPSTHPTALNIDAACQRGDMIITEKSIPGERILSDIAGLVGITFEVPRPDDHFELRLHVSSGVFVNVRHLVVFRLESPV